MVSSVIRKLAGEFTDAQIARILRRKKLLTPKGHSFMAYHVANVRLKHGIAPGPRVPLHGQDVYTAERAAELLGVTNSTVIRWVEAGLLRGAQATSGALLLSLRASHVFRLGRRFSRLCTVE